MTSSVYLKYLLSLGVNKIYFDIKKIYCRCFNKLKYIYSFLDSVNIYGNELCAGMWDKKMYEEFPNNEKNM